jgi:hypothetical protein
MSLPEQIQRQVEQANNIISEYEKGVTESNKPVEPEVVEKKEPVVEPLPEDASAKPSETAAAPPAEDENSPTFAQRWRSLQGTYNAVVRQAGQQAERISQLEQLIASMQTAPAVSQPQATSQQRFLSDKDETDYGSDMVDFARRAAREELAPFYGALEAVRAEVASLKGVVPAINRVAASQAQTADERFFEALGRAVPDWQTVNANEHFLTWLLDADPMTQITRQTYLDDARRSHDVTRTINIFNAWKSLSGEQPKQVSSGPNPAQTELEKQVAPGRALSAPTVAAPQPKKYTPQDIKAFYADVMKGAYKGREAERAQIEKDIFSAQSEGRLFRSAA